MNAPKICPYCGHSVVLTSNKELYGKEYGNGRCCLCRGCGASVGTHTGTKKPLGILATTEMKELRAWCHILFDPIWQSKKIHRSDLYRILARKLGINVKDCHFGSFNKPMLRKALSVMQNKDWWEV